MDTYQMIIGGLAVAAALCILVFAIVNRKSIREEL